MSYFKGDHLRVEIPQTPDGKLLMYDENGRPVVKTDFFPLSAKKRFEQKNERLRRAGLGHLEMTITIVSGDENNAVPSAEQVLAGASTEQLLAALKAKGITPGQAEPAAQEPAAEKKGPGRPAKNIETAPQSAADFLKL